MSRSCMRCCNNYPNNNCNPYSNNSFCNGGFNNCGFGNNGYGCGFGFGNNPLIWLLLLNSFCRY